MIDEPVFEREEFTLKCEGVIKVQMMFGIERAEEFGFGELGDHEDEDGEVVRFRGV